MKKLNNKGFLLVETLIVSVFVLSICLILYRNGMPVIQEYEKRENYDDIDSIYNADTLREFIVNENTNIQTILNEVENNGYKIITCDTLSNKDKCNKLTSALNIDKIIISKWNIAVLQNDITNNNNDEIKNLSKGFKTYIKYISPVIQTSTNNDSYRLIIERTVTDSSSETTKNTYANIYFPKMSS